MLPKSSRACFVKLTRKTLFFLFLFFDSRRNEDLYKATTEKSTTPGSGLVPLIDRNLYKRPAPGSASNSPQNRSPPGQANTNSAPPPSNQAPLPPLRSNSDDYVNPPAVQRPAGRPLRPYRRRRPQIDYYYYDDDYEEEIYNDRGRRRPQQRPRNRRPVYDDYDNRRPYDRFQLSISQFGLPHFANLNKFYRLFAVETTGALTPMTLKTTTSRIGDLIAAVIALNRVAMATIGERTMTDDSTIAEGRTTTTNARLRIESDRRRMSDDHSRTSDDLTMTDESGFPRPTRR